MIYRIRIILDVEEDVFRDIEIEATATLEDLHNTITDSFGFLGNEMASFYKSDDSWQQGDELPLETIDQKSNMRNKRLNIIFSSSQNNLIYIYDFLKMWTFYLELKELGEIVSGVSYPNLINSQGEVPEKAPEKTFKSDSENPFDIDGEVQDDLGNDYDENDFY